MTQAYGETKYVFYDKNVGSGCTLIYIAGSQFFQGDMRGMYLVILISSLILISINVLIIFIFVRKVYRPIMNVEGALHAIVGGETDLKLAKVQKGNELYPVYNDIDSLIVRLKQLIDSEYTAGIMKKQAEIDALQSQINPHFLYNTLESIRGQAIVEEVEGIEKMVKALADIFRYSITNKNAMVKLEEELKNIDNYLNIQQFRFENKFIVIKEIEEDTKSCLIPKLIIQPLVENAIIHGLETKPGKGTIMISSSSTTDSIIISVEDDGEGMDKDTLEAINECLARGVSLKNSKDIKVGLGLININERIKLIFDSSFGLKIYSIKQVGTKVELRIPKTSR
jgi:sensor histidine kinase YesM